MHFKNYHIAHERNKAKLPKFLTSLNLFLWIVLLETVISSRFAPLLLTMADISAV